jgi:hypothetical protein
VRLAVVGVCLIAALVASPAVAGAAGPAGGLDGRTWELVSPIEKDGGEVSSPGGAGAAVFQAATDGESIAYGSAASFGDGEGAAPLSQYLAARGAGGWSTRNLTPPLLSGTYSGGAYQLLSTDLSRGLLSSGWACREGSPCAAGNPPLAAGAPSGYRNVYLREAGAYTPLITTANAPWLSAPADEFQPALQGATPDLREAVLASESNLYEWREGALEQVNTVPGAALAAPSGAISADVSHIYWIAAGNLYLREAGQSRQVDEAQGGGGTFQTASADGSLAFFIKAGHLYRYDATAETSEDLTPTGEVEGVLGASEDGSYTYYLAATGLYMWHQGVTTKIAASADPGNYPPATGTARVTPDGTRLAFTSTASLTGYANLGKAEVFLYEAPSKHLLCASCNPRGTAPLGPSSLPAARSAGEGGPPAYKPRALVADGRRLFFDSADAISLTDTNNGVDVYEWEALGAGTCAKAGGCLELLSAGHAGGGRFLDAGADGRDAFFLATSSLLAEDPGGADVYDARVAGGFPEAQPVPPCDGDECQGPAPGPEDPTPGTATLVGPPNPSPRFPKPKKPGKGKHKKHHHKKKSSHKHGGRR